MDPVAVGDLINDAVTIAKALAATAQALTSPFTGRRKRRETVRETLELVDSLQARILSIQAIALGLQEENGKLRQQIRENDERAAERKLYQRKQVGVGSVALVRKDEPERFFCATCFALGKGAVPLQPRHQGLLLVNYFCPACNTVLRMVPGL